MKKKLSMPTSYAILFGIIFVLAILTWIIPGGQYVENANGELVYEKIGRSQEGLWAVVRAPIDGFYDAVDIALFVLVIGGFIEIVMSSNALDAGISKLLKGFKGRELFLIPILMVLFGLGGTTFGLAEETIAFYPLLIPVMLAAGFDVGVAVMVILLGSGVGVLASTVNPFAIGAATSAANGAGIDIGVGDGLIGRFILFILVEAAAILFTLRYAKKVKTDKSLSITNDINAEIESEFNEIKEVSFERKHGVILGLFGLTFVIMIIGVIPWAYKFDILIFNEINNFFASKSMFSWLGFEHTASDAYFATDTSASALGDWWFGQMTVWFFIMAIVIGLVNKMNNHEITATFIKGSRALLGVALVIGMSRGIQVILTSSGMDATILYYGSGLLENLGKIPYIIFTYVFYLPMSFLIPSTSGLAGATMPIMAPLGNSVYGDVSGAINTITAYSAASGVINLITPTSGVVMGGLAIAKMPYEKWLKHVLPFLLILSGIIIVFLTIISVFNISI